MGFHRAWWSAMASPTTKKSLGQLFCDQSAKLIVKMLADECRQAGVRITTDCECDRRGAQCGWVCHKDQPRCGSQPRRWWSPAAAFRCRRWARLPLVTNSPRNSATESFRREPVSCRLRSVLTIWFAIGICPASSLPVQVSCRRQSLCQRDVIYPSRDQRPGDSANFVLLASRAMSSP